MAKWQKIIVSGSDAELNSLKVGISQSITTSPSTTFLSGSFSGSFQGDGSGLTNIPASGIQGLNLSQIATGSVTASVDINGDIFKITSGSNTLFKLKGNGGLECGSNVTASGDFSHAEGINTQAIGNYSHAEGSDAQAVGYASHAEGYNTIASGSFSHANGVGAQAIGDGSHSEGVNTQAIGNNSHAEGADTQAIGNNSHAEGENTRAIGDGSHSEGINNQAIGNYSHAEGRDSISSGSFSHAEGNDTRAIGEYTHAEGYSTQAIGISSHAEGWQTLTSGSYSHAEGIGTITNENTEGQHAEGKYNINTPDALLVIGNGVDDANRSNLAEFYTSSVIFNSAITASSFSGSFYGDGTGLTGISATTASNITPAITSGNVNNNILTANGDGTVTGESNLTFDGSKLTITGDAQVNNLTVTKDLIVIGTASFQETTNVTVADRFVLLASGSNSSGSGGIVVQQNTQGIGEAIGYNSPTNRWGLTSSFDATQPSFTPSSMIVTAEYGNSMPANPTYGGSGNGFGNIFVSSSGDIFIYA